MSSSCKWVELKGFVVNLQHKVWYHANNMNIWWLNGVRKRLMWNFLFCNLFYMFLNLPLRFKSVWSRANSLALVSHFSILSYQSCSWCKDLPCTEAKQWQPPLQWPDGAEWWHESSNGPFGMLLDSSCGLCSDLTWGSCRIRTNQQIHQLFGRNKRTQWWSQEPMQQSQDQQSLHPGEHARVHAAAQPHGHRALLCGRSYADWNVGSPIHWSFIPRYVQKTF